MPARKLFRLEAQQLGPAERAVLLGVESILALAAAAERFPSARFRLPPGSNSFGLGEPGQEVIDGVFHEQGVEVIRRSRAGWVG